MDELVEILADMIRSALRFEEEHGVQQYCAKSVLVKPLTIIDSTGKVEAPENANKEDFDDHKDTTRKNEPD